jgi:hypothetical protein
LLLAAESKDHLASISKDWKKPKQAFVDLVTVLKAASKRLETALEQAETQAAQLAAGAGLPKTRTKRTPSVASASLVDAAIDVCKSIFNCTLKYDPAHGFRLSSEDSAKLGPMTDPIILNISQEDLRDQCPALLEAAEATLKAFKNKPEYKSTKRCSRKLIDDANVQACSLFANLWDDPKDKAVKLTPEMEQTFAPTLFGMAPDLCEQVSELTHLGTYRAHLIGVRKVICVDTCELLNFLIEKGAVGVADLFTVKDVYKWLRYATVDSAKDFMSKHNVFAATLHKGDLMYLRPGWSFFEGCEQAKPVIGLRRQSLRRDDRPRLEIMQRALKKCNKPNEKLNGFIDKLLVA